MGPSEGKLVASCFRLPLACSRLLRPDILVPQKEGRAREAMVTRIIDDNRVEDHQADDMKEMCSHVALSTVFGGCKVRR